MRDVEIYEEKKRSLPGLQFTIDPGDGALDPSLFVARADCNACGKVSFSPHLHVLSESLREASFPADPGVVDNRSGLIAVIAEALRQNRIEGDRDAHLTEFANRYIAFLPAALQEKKGRLMPGFPQLLERLSQRPHLRLGLATGNFSQGAHLKLAHYGIDHFFVGGGFGEESEDRAEVVRLAIQRWADGASPRDVLIIGDTPHDVSSALANGATAVAVATGRHSAQELRDCGAQLTFEDFADWERAATLLAGS